MRQRYELDVQVKAVRDFARQLKDNIELIELGEAEGDAAVVKDAEAAIEDLQGTLETMALRDSIKKGDIRWEESVIVAHHRVSRYERPQKMDCSSVDEWEAQHRRFHLALVSACDMPLLFSMCESLQHFSAALCKFDSAAAVIARRRATSGARIAPTRLMR